MFLYEAFFMQSIHLSEMPFYLKNKYDYNASV